MVWIGLDELYAGIERVSKEADVTAKELVASASALVTKAAQSNFQGAHRRGEPHTGGDKPNNVTGNLRRSIRPTPIEHVGVYAYMTQVGPTAIYGRRVELGYLGSRGYPYFEPAARDSQPKIAALSDAAWARFISTP